MKKIEIETEWIKLDQLLKFAEIVDSGGVAKLMISEGLVKVNNEVCLMRGKKVKSGDTIEVTPFEVDEDIIRLSIAKKV